MKSLHNFHKSTQFDKTLFCAVQNVPKFIGIHNLHKTQHLNDFAKVLFRTSLHSFHKSSQYTQKTHYLLSTISTSLHIQMSRQQSYSPQDNTIMEKWLHNFHKSPHLDKKLFPDILNVSKFIGIHNQNM